MNKLRLGGLAVVCAGVMAVLTTTLIKVIRPQNQSFAFPQQVPLPTAQFLHSQVQSPQKGNAYSEIIAQRRYQYQYQGLPLEIQISYVTGSSGDLKLLQETYAVNGQRMRPLPQLQMRQGQGGAFALYTHQNRAYLSACLDPGGQSTVEMGQFITHWNSHWYLLGRDYLDDRCLWSHLSMPLDQQSAQEAFVHLESIWVPWYQWWRSRIPPQDR